MFKPSQGAPDDEHPAITGILKIYKGKEDFQCESVLASETGNYEEMQLVGSLKGVYDDCHDEEDREANVLVAFIKANKKKVAVMAAKQVAGWHEVPFLDLFPAYADDKRQKSARASKPRQEEANISSACTIDHDLFGNYILEENSHYFGIDLKYSEAQCRKCKKHFPTPTNQEKKRNVGDLCIPSGKNPAFVCQNWALDNCSCGNIVCNSCFSEMSANKKRTRRPNSYA
jgi:hypothetical protein